MVDFNPNRPNSPADELPTLDECRSGDCFCEYECERFVRGYERAEEEEDE